MPTLVYIGGEIIENQPNNGIPTSIRASFSKGNDVVEVVGGFIGTPVDVEYEHKWLHHVPYLWDKKVAQNETTLDMGLNVVHVIYRVKDEVDHGAKEGTGVDVGTVEVNLLFDDSPYERPEDGRFGDAESDLRVATTETDRSYQHKDWEVPETMATVDESLTTWSQLTIASATIVVGPSGAPAAASFYGPGAGGAAFTVESIASHKVQSSLADTYTTQTTIPRFLSEYRNREQFVIQTGVAVRRDN